MPAKSIVRRGWSLWGRITNTTMGKLGEVSAIGKNVNDPSWPTSACYIPNLDHNIKKQRRTNHLRPHLGQTANPTHINPTPPPTR